VALGLVIFQGVLGGITVLLRLSPIVSTLHLGSSQIFLAVLLSLGMITMSWAGDSWKTKDVSPWLKVSVVALFVQMLLGAFIRHGGAAVACGLGTEALFLCVNPETQSRGLWSPFAEGQTHMLHRYGAIVVSVLILVSTIHCIRWAQKEGRRDLRILSVLTHGLLVLQVVIGLWTVGSGIAAWPVSLHLIFGMLLWLTMLALHHRTASQLPLMWPRGAPQHERREAFSV
jgi:heme A synthase